MKGVLDDLLAGRRRGLAGLLLAALVAFNIWFNVLRVASDADFFERAPDQRLIGGGIDLPGTVWTFYQVSWMMAGKAGLSAGFFHPVGYDMVQNQGLGWLDAVLAWPLMMIWGVPGFYNHYLVILLASTTLAAAALARQAGASWPAAVLLGCATVSSPFMERELFEGRPTQVHLVFHCLFLLFVLRRSPVAAGVCLAAAAYVYPFSAVALGITAALTVLPTWRQELRFGLRLSATALLLTLPAAAPVLWGYVTGAIRPGVAADGMLSLGLFQVPIAEANDWSIFDLRTPWTRSAMSTSLFVGGMLSAALLVRERRTWVLVTLISLSWILGSTVSLFGLKIPTIFALSHLVFPPMVRDNFPDRLVVVPMLLLLVLVAEATSRLGRKGLIAAGCLWGFTLTESGTPGVMTAVPVLDKYEFYDRLARLPAGAVIDIPLLSSNEDFHYQIIHHRPLLGGPGIRGVNTQPAAHKAMVESNTYLANLESVCEEGTSLSWNHADLEALLAAGFRLVVVHSEGCTGDLGPALGMPVAVKGTYKAYVLNR